MWNRGLEAVYGWLKMLESFLDLGNMDFVATMLALNLATDIWQPLKNKLEERVETLKSPNNAIKISSLDNPELVDQEQWIKSGCSAKQECVEKKLKSLEGLLPFCRTSSYLCVVASALVLYSGYSSSLWLVFTFPIVWFFLRGNYLGKSIKKQSDELQDIYEKHVGRKLLEDLKEGSEISEANCF